MEAMEVDDRPEAAPSAAPPSSSSSSAAPSSAAPSSAAPSSTAPSSSASSSASSAAPSSSASSAAPSSSSSSAAPSSSASSAPASSSSSSTPASSSASSSSSSAPAPSSSSSSSSSSAPAPSSSSVPSALDSDDAKPVRAAGLLGATPALLSLAGVRVAAAASPATTPAPIPAPVATPTPPPAAQQSTPRMGILLDGEVIRSEAEEELEAEEVVRRALSSYEPIEKCVYIEGARRADRGQIFTCDCSYERGDPLNNACGDGCMNRNVNVECNVKTCPCKAYCTNRRMQTKEYAAVEVFRTPKKGCGLRTLMDLPKGALVMEYCGEVLSRARYEKRKVIYKAKGMRHLYSMALDSETMIDATRKGAISRFINHSCDPNCETQKWTVDGILRLGLFTSQPIKKGEELTFNYGYTWGTGEQAQKCYCGSAKCTGYIGKIVDRAPAAAPSDAPSATADAPVATPAAGEGEGRDPIDDEELNTSIDDEADATYTGGHGLADEAAALALIENLTISRNLDTALYALHQLEISKTEPLRDFISHDGLKVLRGALATHIANPTVAIGFLQVLRKLPALSRPVVDGAELEPFLARIATMHASDAVIQSLLAKQRENWDAMHNAYKIPKRPGEAPSSETGPNGTQPATGTLGSPAPATPSSSTRSDAQRATTTTTTTTGTASPIGAPASRPSPLLGVLDKFQSSNRFASVSVPLAPLKRPASSEAEPDTSGRSRSYGYDDDDSAARRKRAALDSPAATTSSTGSSSTAKDTGPTSATPAAAAAPAAAPVLPEGWYSSKDALGNTYYYHAETSVTQWEVPQAPLAPPPPPPPEVLQALQAAATATAPAVAPSSSSTSAATLKFRDELAKHIVHVLAKWKNELDVETFKQTARKLTHAIEEKEQKTSSGPLVLTDDIRKKAGKYVVSHMTSNLEVLKKANKAASSKAHKASSSSSSSASRSGKPSSSSKPSGSSKPASSSSSGKPRSSKPESAPADA